RAGGRDRLGGGERGEERVVGRGLKQAGKQCVEIRARGFLRGERSVDRDRRGHRVHRESPPSLSTETSFFEDIMSTTRQSPHICSLRSAPSPANIEWPASLPSMDSTICLVPKALPQETQWKGSVRFTMRASRACGVSSKRG